jgi:hypothetical protein
VGEDDPWRMIYFGVNRDAAFDEYVRTRGS